MSPNHESKNHRADEMMSLSAAFFNHLGSMGLNLLFVILELFTPKVAKTPRSLRCSVKQHIAMYPVVRNPKTLFELSFFNLFKNFFIRYLFLKFIFNWKELLYSVPLVSAIHQCKPVIIIHVSPPSSASFPSPDPTLLGHHRVLGWAPCVIKQLLTSYLFYTW